MSFCRGVCEKALLRQGAVHGYALHAHDRADRDGGAGDLLPGAARWHILQVRDDVVDNRECGGVRRGRKQAFKLKKMALPLGWRRRESKLVLKLRKYVSLDD